MDSPDPKHPPAGEQRTLVRVLEVIDVSRDDLERAAAIPPHGCPRRYCWWWTNLSFEWELTPAEGCTLLKSEKRPSWKYSDMPCCRSDPASHVDHFEPREPHIEADGIDPSGWLSYRSEKNKDL
jgi:hypothetical protein